jgi:hypothetical protein
VQIDAPWTVSAFLQRMGRTGVRVGATRASCICSRLPPGSSNISASSRAFATAASTTRSPRALRPGGDGADARLVKASSREDGVFALYRQLAAEAKARQQG